jgi:ribosomal protein L17
MQNRLKAKKDSELKELREKFEKMIEEVKRNAANERDFLQKEMQRKIDDLEKEIAELKARFEDEKNGLS